MSKLFLMIGLPASGKSTFCNQFKGDKATVISRDVIRLSLLKPGEEYYSHENEVFPLYISQIKQALTEYDAVFADATHLSSNSRFRVIDHFQDVPIYAIYMQTPKKVCIERNSHRTGRARVPYGQMKSMSKALEMPSLSDPDFAEVIYVRGDGEWGEVNYKVWRIINSEEILSDFRDKLR